MHTRSIQKTILAAAALLAVGAAQAQSSVVAYGLIDLAIDNYKYGNNYRSLDGTNQGGADKWTMNDGTVNGFNGSRVGFRVSEDLGSGLRANAVLEMGLLADTGASAQGGLAFGRQAYVGMSSTTWGEFRMGRQYILEDHVMSLSNPWGNAAVNNQGTAVTNMGRNLPFWLNAPRANNLLIYQTPSFGGFYAAAEIAPGEGTADRFQGVKFAYESGPIKVATSYEWNESRFNGEDVNKSLTIGGNYNFGVLKLMGGYQQDDDLVLGSGNGAFTGNNLLVTSGGGTFLANAIKSYTIGVEIPTGAFSWGINYTGLEYEGAAGASATLGKAAATGRYNLSKSTFLYSGISMSTGDLKEYILEKQVFQAGMRMAW